MITRFTSKKKTELSSNATTSFRSVPLFGATYANMHEEFMKGKITIIGCPKLDEVDYTEKLTGIIRDNDIRSVTIVRMEVPCCGGLQRAAENALKASGKFIPWQVVTISRDGRILD